MKKKHSPQALALADDPAHILLRLDFLLQVTHGVFGLLPLALRVGFALAQAFVDMPLLAQSRLLRVLQDHEIERVGGSFAIRVDARALAATHRDLKQLVAEGRFREDLYYRLNVIPIELPPLRERRDDIIPLAHFFVSRFNAKHGAQIDGISDASLKRLCAYDWPGNVRELENIIERAVILSSGSLLDLSQSLLPAETERAEKAAAPAVFSSTVGVHSVTDLSGTADEVQRQYMLQVLERTRWVIEGPHGAAAQLGLKPSTLRNRMHKLGTLCGDVTSSWGLSEIEFHR